MEKNIKIIVATHKNYRMPTDPMYIPLHVGAEGNRDDNGVELDLGYVKDNTGDNISSLNPYFCELTGLYWAWKNLRADYIGLVHYRRHFCIKKTDDLFKSILTYNQIEPLTHGIKIFVPSKRKYYIESLYSHYAHTHYSSQLDLAREVIGQKYPDYLPSYDCVVNLNGGYMFNMLIMEKECFDSYCSWLFDILFEIRQRIQSIENMSAFQARFYGRVSEIIFNVWLDYQIRCDMITKSEIMEIPFIYMEKVNWPDKCSAFIRAKLFNKKYERSF